MPLSRILCNEKEYGEFQRNCAVLKPYCDRSYDYTGVNFDDSSIISIKSYKTFFRYHEFFSLFPFPELKERILSYRDRVSRHHMTTPFVPGCGFTYTLKVDNKGFFSRGVYFRVCCDSGPYVKSFLSRMDLPGSFCEFFDRSGVLKYISIDGDGEIRERSYIYCVEPAVMDKFDSVSGVSFSKADCLEISTGWDGEIDSNGMSIIGLSRKALADESIQSRGSEVEKVLRQHGIIKGSNFSLYGYYLQRRVHSVYFFDDRGVALPRFQGHSSRKSSPEK